MVKLSRRRQDAIMVPIAVAYRELHRQVTGHYPPESEGTNDEMLRDVLRLDDPVLDELIAAKESSGQPWGPWQTATYKERTA